MFKIRKQRYQKKFKKSTLIVYTAVTHKQRFVQKSDSLSRKELKMSPLQLQSMGTSQIAR